MTRVDEFDSFYRSTAANALTVTYALSGDRDATRDAVVGAYRQAWRNWSKIRLRRPLEFVRSAASSSVRLGEATHPIRHRHQVVEDPGLFSALSDLPFDSRRLLVLMTLGNTDLERAARETGVEIEEAIERATAALSGLEQALDLDISAVEERIIGLARVKLGIRMPAAATIRETALRGQRRSVVITVAAAVALILAGGAMSTTGGLFTRITAAPDRERLGAETADTVLDAATIDADHLLTSDQVHVLDPTSTWRTVSTDDDPSSETPYATCPTTRYATDHPLRVFVRTLQGSAGHTRVAQAIEVATSDGAAANALRTVVGWYVNCQHPRVQLLGAYGGGRMTVLRLVSHRQPVRTFTVGVTRTGNAITTLVYEADGTRAPPIGAFSKLLTDALDRLCIKAGGPCHKAAPRMYAAEPPPTSKAPAFLGIVDLPPIGNVDHVWAGVDLGRGKSDPSQTLCKDPAAPKTARRDSRLYVIPQAGLPEAFGVAETVATFRSRAAAKAFLGQVASTLSRCERANLSASVSRSQPFRSNAYRGFVWQLQFELSKNSAISYRTAVIQRGNTVAKVTFTPAGNLDMSRATFVTLAKRAAERLRYAQ